MAALLLLGCSKKTAQEAGEAAPEQTAAEQTAPEQTAPEQAAPGQAAVERTAAEQTAAEQTNAVIEMPQAEPRPGSDPQAWSELQPGVDPAAPGQAVVSMDPASPVTNLPGLLEEVLRRPSIAEGLRYPQDSVIGELGSGGAAPEAYAAAQRTLNALLIPGRREAALAPFHEKAALKAILDDVAPIRYHIGGAQSDADRLYSFLVRFLGREKESAGEIYLSMPKSVWVVEDLILEEGKQKAGSEAVPAIGFPSYERFF
jgi:hypothetical protein